MDLSFIIIDDSELDCFIARKIIGQIIHNAPIETFLAARDALAHIAARPINSQDLTIIILDLMMPVMNGFQFIESFEKLPQALHDKYFMVALTSSMNKKDLNRLHNYLIVKDVLDKPFTAQKMNAVIKKVNEYKHMVPGSGK
jgi:CheY-like chemotaxis protein